MVRVSSASETNAYDGNAHREDVRFVLGGRHLMFLISLLLIIGHRFALFCATAVIHPFMPIPLESYGR
jgi:hypothetical protein